MLGGQWRGCQASVVLARVTRKENVRALGSLSQTKTDSRISSHVNKPFNNLNIREISNSSALIQVSAFLLDIWMKFGFSQTNLRQFIVIGFRL